MTEASFRNYRIVNTVVAAWVVYLLLLPFLSYLTTPATPQWVRESPHRALSPFHGMTRDFQDVYYGRWNAGGFRNRNTPLVLYLLVFELVVRCAIVFMARMQRVTARLMAMDFAVHIPLCLFLLQQLLR